MRQYLLLPIVIIATILIALFARIPPSDVSSSGFDLARAMADVETLSRAPRPVGSADHEQARLWLEQKFNGLGLEVQSQGGVGVRQANFDARRKGAISVSPYRNVIAVLPGRDRNKSAVLLMAHYDSVPWAYGASDDAAGVATVLETARSLKEGAQPLRDVIFLLTDAEEPGLIGAQEFFDTHPLSARTGLVINVEARGSRGKAIMFQTSNENGALIDLWAKTAVRPTGNSMANAVYQRLPNDTDLSVSLAKGKAGINAAFIDGLADYHMPTDSVENLDPRALGHVGAFGLTITRALANSTALPKRQSDSAYFDVFGLFVIRYPLVWGWALVALGGIGLGFAGVGRIGVSWIQAARATVGVFALTLITGAVLHFGMNLLSGKGMMNLRDRINEMDGALWPFIAIVAGSVLIAKPRAGMWVGGIIACLLAALAAQIWMPGGSWIFGWAALLGVAMLFLAARNGIGSPVLIYAAAIFGGLWGALLLEGLITTYMTIGPATAAPMVLIIPLALALIGPVLGDASKLELGRKVGVGLLVVAFATLAWMSATVSFSERHPKPRDLFHLTDANANKSWWATSSSKQQLPTGAVTKIKQKAFAPILWHVVAAPASNITKPVISLNETAGRMVLSASSATPPRALWIAVKPSKTLGNARVNGKSVRIPAGQATRIMWRTETGGAELKLEFDQDAGGKIALEYIYALSGLPTGAPPADGVDTDWSTFDRTRVVMGSQKFSW